VVEVGAGLGSLTVALALSGAKVLALEVDRQLIAPLRETVESLGVEVHLADAMTVDWPAILREGAWVVVANLPYNIGAPLVLRLLANAPMVERMVVMVQREVGERLAASPGDDAYGAPSARLAYFADARLVGRVPASVFLPRPNVESVLVEIVRRPSPAVDPDLVSYEEVSRLISLGYGKRRKMLRRSLAGAVDDKAFRSAGIGPTRRAEELGIEQWGRLAAAVRSAGATSETP
jgi:16S rRNA (adenine1518-N6/adenine1519-N6)-dimethyltransferase